MTHTSGIIRYEFDDRFISDLLASPDKVWLPEELLAYLFDTDAPFAPGEGWEYSDTNYIILGKIIESLTGNTYYDEMRRRILEPLGLHNTVPTDTRRIPGPGAGVRRCRESLPCSGCSDRRWCVRDKPSIRVDWWWNCIDDRGPGTVGKGTL